jgi:hypothetical protein
VYTELATHTLIWDNQETLDINGYIDAIQKLSTAFDFDITEVRNRTGLPIIGAKSTVVTPPDPGGQKKKPDAILKGLAPYAQLKPAFVIYAATWDAAIERLANQLYSGEVKPADLDKDLVLKNYAAFSNEGAKAFGEDYYNSDLCRNFRENFLKFAGAKSYALMSDIAAIDARTGMSRESFIAQAKTLVQKHNEQYLATELRYCNSSVTAARDYQTYLDDEDIYPNLKCRTMADDDVRDSHQLNEGIVKPVREWTSTPPFDHGCRCWLEQTHEEPTSGRKLQGIKFPNNPHQSGKVFTQEQSYFNGIPDTKRGIIRDNTEQMKAYAPYNHTIKAGENTVFVNDFADLADLKPSIAAAEKVANALQQDVYIRHHIQNSDKTAIKNPEIGLGKPNNLADLKTFDSLKSLSTPSFIKNGIKSANKQQCSTVIFDLSAAPEPNTVALSARKLRGELSDKSGVNKGIKQVIIIHNETVLKVTRQQINSKKFMEYFKTA